MKLYYSSSLRPIIILKRSIFAHEKVKICKNPICLMYMEFKSKPMGLKRLVLGKITWCIDIIALIRHLVRVEYLNRFGILEKLGNVYNFLISQSQVYESYSRYMALLS